MATAEVQLIVEAISKNLRETAKQLNTLTGETKKSAKASRESAAAQAEHDYKLSQGVRGTAAAGRSMSKLTQTIGSGPNGLVGAYATLAANAFAVSASFEALRTGAQVNQILNGLELQGARTGRALTLTAKGIEQITQGALSGADAMRAAALGTSAGLSGKDIRELTEVATNASLVLGRNIPDSMDRIIKGVTKLEPELLDELGLMTKLTEASENYARANGKSAASLTNMEKRLAFVESIKAEGTLKYDGVAEELGTNNLDKLAAAFTNLVHEMTGAIATSKALSAAISTMTDSSLGMQGALLILGSYVARQYTASLRESSIKTLEASKILDQKARALKEHTKTQMGATKATLDQARADSMAAASLNRRQTGRAATTQQGALAGDRAAQEAWIKSRENSTKRFEKELAKLSGTETDAAKKRIASINQSIQANNLEIESTRAAIKAQDAYASAKSRTAQTDIRMRAAQQGSLAQGRAALAMEAASALKVGQSYRNIIDSTRSYSRQLQLTAQASAIASANALANGKSIGFLTNSLNVFSPAVLRARVALHAVTLGVKTLGIAFATALPWIGVITVAFSMAQAAYENFFKSSETKAKETALKDLNTVLDTLTTSTKEYEKVQKATNISIGEKALKALTIQTNAMVELTDAYLALSEAANKASSSIDKSLTVEQRLDELNPILQFGKSLKSQYLSEVPFLDTEAMKKQLNLSTDIAAQASIKMMSGLQKAGSLVVPFYDGISKQNETLSKTIDTIAVYDKKLAETIDISSDTEITQANIAEALRKAQPVWQKAQLAVQNFAEAVKTAETAQTDFMRSIVPSTKFDNVVSAFTGLNKSMVELQKTLGDNRFDDAKFSEVLTNLGPSTIRTLDVSDQLNLDAVKTQYSEISTLQREIKDLQEQGLGKSQESISKEARVAELKERIKVALKNSEPSILAATREYQKQLVSAQVMSITMQGNMAIAQAHLAVLQKRGVVTANDAAKQLKAENSIIALQQEQLKIEKIFLDIDIAKQQSRLKELDDNLKLLKTLKDIGLEERKRLIDQQIRTNVSMAESARLRGDEKVANILEAKNATLERSRVGAAEEYNRALGEQEDLESDIRRAKAGSVALSKQISALGMQANSGSEISAARARKQLEIDTNRASARREIDTINDSIIISEREIYNILTQATDEIDLQLLKIAKSSEQKRKALDDEYDQKKRALDIEVKLAKAQGLQDRVDFYAEERKILDERYSTSSRQVDIEELRERLQISAIKNTEERLNLEKEALNVLQKSADSIRELSNANLESFNLIVDLEAKRRGVTNSEAIQNIKAVKAAEESAKLAEAEYNLKVSIITLEFALLEAQRIALIDSLSKRRDILEQDKNLLSDIKASGNNKLNSEGGIEVVGGKLATTNKSISDLSKTIDALNNSDYKTAFNNALEAAKVLKDNTKLNASLVKARGPRVTEGFSSTLANMQSVAQSGLESGASNASIAIDIFKEQFESMKTSLEELGPQGQVVVALSESAMNISNSFIDAFNTMSQYGTSSSQGMVASLQAVSAIIGGIQSILTAATNAKIANIDREIAAEDKRDGKSAASVAKLDALEKKKDAMARKSFNTNKKLMMAQAAMSTAAAVIGTLAAASSVFLPPVPQILAAAVGAMGLAQLAIISSTQYESSYTPRAAAMPSSLSIGKRSDSVDLAKGPNANAGGEAGFIRGNAGMGSNASNYRTVGSAYGGELFRGYGNRGFVVGEKGPEVINPETPVTVTPANENTSSTPVNATFNIQALDASGVQDILVQQKGNIIKMLRDAANSSGQRFLEDVNVNVLTRPNVGKL